MIADSREIHHMLSDRRSVLRVQSLRARDGYMTTHVRSDKPGFFGPAHC